MGRSGIHGLNRDPPRRNDRILEVCRHEPFRYERADWHGVGGDPIEPRDVAVIGWSELGAVVLVCREMLMDDAVTIAALGIVAMFLRQCSRQGE